MMGFEQAIAYLPEEIARVLRALPTDERKDVHEIRLRAGEPVTLGVSSGERLVTAEGRLTVMEVPRLLRVRREQVEECFMRMCEYSVHAHQQEILQGYLQTKEGGRVGLAGRAVVDGDRMVSVRDIRSLCLRIANPYPGCADALLDHIVQNGRIQGTLVCGEPSAGKTSLLRDAGRQLAAGIAGRRFRVCVVDERGELSAGMETTGCDVLLHFPKARGLRQAVRCLAPDVVIFDEVGDLDEARAVAEGMCAGVAVVCSAHAADWHQAMGRPPVRAMLESGGIDCAVMLAGRHAPGQIAAVRDVKELLYEAHRSAAASLDRDWQRTAVFQSADSPGGCFAVV